MRVSKRSRAALRETPHQSDAVPEDVVDPAYAARLRVDSEVATQQPLIIAVARPEHQVMLAETHRPPVVVGRDMPYAEDRHARSASSPKEENAPT